jgi:NitT/TauT family transport system ATP-binding protein
MIRLDKVTFTHSQNKKPIFEDFNWEIKRSERWVVLGPSGCGKTTLLYMLAGILFPQNGLILFDGTQISRPRPESGLILQDYGLLPWATVRENCALGLKIRKLYGADGVHAPRGDYKSGKEGIWLKRLGLVEFEDKYPHQLSGGQRQRTAIARTLVLRPDLLLMDEPFSSLDVQSRESLQDLTLSLLAEFGMTLILVTHSIEEAATMGEKILILKEPPNMEAFIVDNPITCKDNYRNSISFKDTCNNLRLMLGISNL